MTAHRSLRSTAAVLVAAVVVTLVPTASAERVYAGLTRSQAVARAKADIIALSIAFNGTTPSQAARLRRQLDAHEPRATPSACKGIRAWRVKWPDSDPIFVNRGGIVMACYVKVSR